MVPAVSLTRGGPGVARAGSPLVTTLGASTTKPATTTVPASTPATSNRDRPRRRAARRRRRTRGFASRFWDTGFSVSAPVGSSEVYKVRAFMRVATVVLAAGTSQRFGGRPKQFEQLGDSTVLQHAVRAFLDVDRIAEVWVVTSATHELSTRTLLGGEKIT